MTKDFSAPQLLASKRRDSAQGSLRWHTSGFIVAFAPASVGDDDDGEGRNVGSNTAGQ
jgi:hypothetical protein